MAHPGRFADSLSGLSEYYVSSVPGPAWAVISKEQGLTAGVESIACLCYPYCIPNETRCMLL